MSGRPEEKAAVIARDLTLNYGGGDGVNGLDLRIPQGCKFGLLGPNGAGKSTTLKLFMGMLRPDGGDLSVLDQPDPAQHPELRARIGYVPERHHIYRWMSVGEVVRFARAFYPTWNDALCDELLAQYGLDDSKRVDQLSHGMTTKLALVLALSHEPELLILDEPTTGLDPLIREEFLSGILHPLLAQTERTVVFSSHIMSDIESVCDTIAILYGGRLLECCARDALLSGTKRVRVLFDSPDQNIPAPANTIYAQPTPEGVLITLRDFEESQLPLLEKLVGVRRVAVEDLALEDIFKDYIKGARAKE